jgi:hypothetical protein
VLVTARRFRLAAAAAVLCATVAAGPGSAAAAAPATPDFPLISALYPAVDENAYAFDLVITSRWHDPAEGKRLNPRALWFMTGLDGATYGDNIIDTPGFNKDRCILRHADGSGWGIRPFNMTLPDCVDYIADTVASFARAGGLYTAPWDGIYQDALSYHPYQWARATDGGLTDVDANLDGKPDTQAELESAWLAGMRRYAARLRADLPGKLIFANGVDWRNDTDLDGIDGNTAEHVIDEFRNPQYGWNMQVLLDHVNRWYATDTGRPRIYNTISYWNDNYDPLPPDARQRMELDPEAQRRMRFGLATATMAGIYFDFQYGSALGASAIYDEYRGGDLDRQGYLGQPLGPPKQISTGLWRRDFEHGVTFANEGGAAATVDVTGQGLRHLKGAQNPIVNDGSEAGVLTIPSLDGLFLVRDDVTPPPVEQPPPPPAPEATSAPAISGSAQPGQVLTASEGVWTGDAPLIRFQWQRCDASGAACNDILGATGETYLLAFADIGATIRVAVTASNRGGTTTAFSVPTAVVAPPVVEQNLALDSDFEAAPGNAYYTAGACAFSWATDAANSGTHSLKIVSQSSAELCRWLSTMTDIPARAGTTYSAAVWLKTESTGYGEISINFWNAGNGYLGTYTSNRLLAGSQGWTPVDVQATAPSGTAWIRIEFRLHGAGTIWADDVSLVAS